jgi:phage shock protein A
MKTTALYLVAMLFIPMIYSVRISADRFTEIQNQIKEFCGSITSEGVEANIRYETEKKWCNAKIKEAEELVEKRKKEVTAIENQKKGLENKIADNEKAIKHYNDKIAENNRTMEQFKKDRCDANFNFISLLREHFDAEELLKALKKDIGDFLDKKIANPEDASAKLPTAFLERVSSISHMIPAQTQTNLIQLVQAANPYVQAADVSGNLAANAANQFSARAIDNTMHIDNTQEELKALEHIKSINPKEYFMKLKVKIDNIIDGLISHMENSKRDLSEKEMKANQDYAKFMIALDKENIELARLVRELVAENVSLNEQLKKTVETLEEFRKLLKAAEDNLAALRQMCKEKDDYHTAEEQRRAKETGQCDEAAKIFNDIVGTDEELKKLINNEADLKKSDILEKKADFEGKRTANKAEDVKIVF